MTTPTDPHRDHTETASVRAWPAEALESLPVVLTFHSERHVVFKVDSARNRFRQAFAIVVDPSTAGRFNIHLHYGASSTDLKTAQHIVSEAKKGHSKPPIWRSRGDGSWIYRAWWGHRDKDHYDELRECTRKACVKACHEWMGNEQFEPCSLEPILADWYSVHAFKIDGRWVTSASTVSDPPEAEEGLKAVRDLANDYARMLGECERLNGSAYAGESVAP